MKASLAIVNVKAGSGVACKSKHRAPFLQHAKSYLYQMMRLGKLLRNLLKKVPESDAETAYDLWAESYDAQPDNLVLALDESVFHELLAGVNLAGKNILDIGCGTGRHWAHLLAQSPSSLSGYDVSQAMIDILKEKMPGAKAHKMDGVLTPEPANTCDIVISTLALAHIPDGFGALQEWARVLKKGGDIILTDYHPQALKKGTSRTFRHDGKLHAVKNYVYPIDVLQAYARQLDLSVVRLVEKKIDESVRAWYDRQGASAVYERFKGTPIVYGIHLSKTHAPA